MDDVTSTDGYSCFYALGIGLDLRPDLGHDFGFAGGAGC